MDKSNSELTDDQRKALAYHHLGNYKRGLRVKKDADAAFKNLCKIAKGDGVSLAQIKKMLALEEDEDAVKADLQETLQIARWANSTLGTQFDWVDEAIDRTPLDERAYEDGKTAGMKGETLASPYEGDAGNEWARGWHDGQGILAATLDLTKAAAEAAAQEQAEKPKRGRPKGSKNRPKEVEEARDVEEEAAAEAAE